MDAGSRMMLAAVIVLLFVAAYFAVAETSFASVSRNRLKIRQERGERKAKKALYVLDNFDKAITTILIGTNIVHIAAGAIVTVFVTRKWGLSAVALGTLVTTIVVFFLGEMLPKSVAKKYSERFSLSTASSLCFFMTIFTPISSLLTSLGQTVADWTKGDPEVSVTEDELYDIIEDMTDEGTLGSERGELMSSALQFAELTAETVLTARVDVAAINAEWDQTRVLDFIKEQKHSRLPVYDGSIDHIIGVLQIRKYIKTWLREGEKSDLRAILDEAYFVHRSMNIDELLTLMSAKKLNMAVVTDNYGGTLGIVTVEDILEELVGEIWDEDDDVEESFVPLGGGRFEVDAELTVGDAFDCLDIEPEDYDELEYKLMGEWAYEHFDRIPKERDAFVYEGLEVTVSDMRQNRIVKLVCRLLPEGNQEGGDEK